MARVRVTFTTATPPYVAGETAHFSTATANALIAAGRGVSAGAGCADRGESVGDGVPMDWTVRPNQPTPEVHGGFYQR
jgi:hypothetical protein